MDHIAVIAIMALAAMGMWTAMGDQMILEAWRKVVEKRTPVWVQKMLAICPRCMVTLYGTAAALAVGWHFDPLLWIVYVPCAVGLQELVQR